MKKFYLINFLLILFFTAFAQEFEREDFNEGELPPTYTPNTPPSGNQFTVTANSGNSINGTPMLYIKSTQNQNGVYEVVFPIPLSAANFNLVSIAFAYAQIAQYGTRASFIHYPNGNINNPQQLWGSDQNSCDRGEPWFCNNFLFDVYISIPNFGPNDMFAFVFEDPTGSGTDLFAVDDIIWFGFEDNCNLMIREEAIQSATCADVDNGAIFASAFGGTPPYAFSIDGFPEQPIGDFFNLFAGDYTMIVTDADDCSAVLDFTIEAAPPLEISVSSTPANCKTGMVSQAVIEASGGTPPYSYKFSDGFFELGSSDGSLDSLDVGTWIAIVEDSEGCIAEIEFMIEEDIPFDISIETNNTTCPESYDGSATITANGTPPFVVELFSIVDEDTTFLFTSGLSISDITSGDYYVDVYDAFSCKTSGAFTIGFTYNTTLNLNITQPACANADGSLTAILENGVIPIEYTLSYEDFSGPVVVSSNNTGIFTDVPVSANLYSVSAIDANGCSDIQSFNISIVPILIQTDITNTKCADSEDGAIIALGFNGTPPYTYSLGSETNNTGIFTDLAAGTYSILVKDKLDCEATTTVTVESPDALEITVNKIAPLCFGQDGELNFEASGGTPPYLFKINNGGFGSTNNFQLPSGNYSITVRDDNGCEKTVQDSIPNTLEITADVDVLNVTCNGKKDGQIEVKNVRNAKAPVTYKLNGVAGGPAWNDLDIGNYIITITDGNNCTKTYNETIIQPDPLILNATPTDVTCSGRKDGKIEFSVTGGTPDYEISVDGGPWIFNLAEVTDLEAGEYDNQVRDANGCGDDDYAVVEQPNALFTDTVSVTPSTDNNGAIDISTVGGTPNYNYNWSNGATTQDIEDLASGDYWVVTEDANNCKTDTLYVTVPLVSSSPIAFQEGTIRLLNNPADKFLLLEIKIQHSNSTALNVQLINISGSVVLNKQLLLERERSQIDVEHLPGGIYFLRCQINNQSISRKIVIK